MVDDDIAAIFATVAQDIEPDLAAVIGEATRQGRRRRARRRLAIACTASASLVAVAVAATVAAHLASAKVHGSPAIGPGGHRHAPALKPKAHHTRRAVPQAHGPGMKPSKMLAVLRPMLPAGGVITYVSPATTRGGLEINFNDGKGAVDIMLDVEKTYVPPNAQPGDFTFKSLSCPHPLWTDEGQRPVGALPISCVRLKFAGGAIERDAVMYADAAGFYGYDIYYTRPDGITVFIQVGNGTLEGTPHLTRAGWPYVDRAQPPGSMALWRSVVESPKWHL
jgi:hypothetical protein